MDAQVKQTRKRTVFGRVKFEYEGRKLTAEMSPDGIAISERYSRDEPLVIPLAQLVDFRRNKFQYRIEGRLVEFEIHAGNQVKMTFPEEMQAAAVAELANKIHDDTAGQPRLL